MKHIPLLSALLALPLCGFAQDAASSNAVQTVAVPGFHGVRMAVFPVTNGDYARFCKDAGHKPPAYWKDGTPPVGKERHPVVEVSLADAEAYAAWLTARTPGVRFRLPTEEEWVAAAQGSVPVVFNGPLVARLLAVDPNREVEFVHPKSERRGEKVRLSDVLSLSERGGVRGWADHARHCGFIDTDLFKTLSADGGATAPVDAPDASRSAAGCRDMAGNTWDWTSTIREAKNGAERGRLVNVVKGGSWYANRTSCLPGFEGEGRAASGRYNTVGFRLAAEMAAVSTPAEEPSPVFRDFDVRKEFADNPFTAFTGRGMLLCAGDREKSNAMTIGWGALGTLWGRNDAVTVYVAESRYTKKFLDGATHFTVMELDKEKQANILAYMGRNSGRDGDKTAALGLHTAWTENGTPYYLEAQAVYECELMYSAPFDPAGMKDIPKKLYADFPAGVHTMYIGRIVRAFRRE